MIEAYRDYVDLRAVQRSDYWFACWQNMLTFIAFYVLLAIFGGIASATESSFGCYFIYHPIYLFAFGIAAILLL